MKSFNTGFAIGDYIWMGAELATSTGGYATNRGLFTISAINSNGLAITVDNNYYSDQTKDGDLASVAAGFTAEVFGDVADSAGENNWGFKQVLLCEGCYITISGVHFMEDEDFELDIPAYLSKALVYYVKAKMAEDKGDIQIKEYFMKEFKKMIEKKNSSNIWGSRKIMPGANAIR